MGGKAGLESWGLSPHHSKEGRARSRVLPKSQESFWESVIVMGRLQVLETVSREQAGHFGSFVLMVCHQLPHF